MGWMEINGDDREERDTPDKDCEILERLKKIECMLEKMMQMCEQKNNEPEETITAFHERKK